MAVSYEGGSQQQRFENLQRERAERWSSRSFSSELGEASLEQGDDGGVLAALSVIEGSGAIMISETRISTSKQQGSHGLKLATLRGKL